MAIEEFVEEIKLSEKGSHWIISRLSKKQILEIQKEVDSWESVFFTTPQQYLKETFRIEVPPDLLKQVFKNNLNLIYELETNLLGDTAGRELLVNAVLLEINMREWPKIFEGDKVLQDFIKKLDLTLPKFGGTFLGFENTSKSKFRFKK